MKPNRRFLLYGGLSGVLGGLFFVTAVFLDVGTASTVMLIFCWALFMVIFMHALFVYIEEPRPSITARIGLVLAICGFATVFTMIVVQLAVKSGTDYYKNQFFVPGTEDYWKNASSMLRLIDMGMDIAWDVFIGGSLIFFGFAMYHRTGLRAGWSILAITAGALLIFLNLLTFPFPPNTRGLFDIGPYILLYMILLALRLASLGRLYYAKDDYYAEIEKKP